MDYAIGIDIGVTNIKSVCVQQDGTILTRSQFSTHSDSVLPGRVREHVGELLNHHGATTHLGIAAPGLAAPDGSRITWMQGRLSEIQELNWTERLNWSAVVPVLNDAHAALLGEVWLGAARGARHAILLTLGTGVGGAILADGRILRGHIGRAGHLGHISLDPRGELDIVNTPGSLEQAIGDYTITQRSAGRFQSTHDLVQACQAGDVNASKVWETSLQHLAAAIASLINVVDPELVIIGGGIAFAGDALFVPLRRWLDRFEWRPHNHTVELIPAQLGEFAGALGAAYNAWNQQP